MAIDPPAAVEDHVAIAQLRAAYSHYIDAGAWGDWADLFATDATCDFGFRTVEGRDNVEAFGREEVAPRFEDSYHMAHMPLLDLDGDTGSGRWYLHVYYVRPEASGWILGRYRDEYVRTEEGWKFQAVTNEVSTDTGDLFAV